MRDDIRAGAPSGRDGGFTLTEILITVVLLGLVTATLAAAITTSLAAAPQTDARIDDARSTRTLATWLSHDTTSAPPFLPEQPTGGIDITTVATGDNNDCGGVGTNLLHLQWRESAALTTTYVANYRFVVEDGEGVIMRYACSKVGAASFGTTFARAVTPSLDAASLPTVTVDQPVGGDVLSVSFALTGLSGEQVLVETASRNPADFFP